MTAGAGAPASARQAVALGLLQGPCELLPISSSAHLTLVPWLLRRPRDGNPALEKALDATLHAGSAAVLVVLLRSELRGTRDGRRHGGTLQMLLACAPPALAGGLGEGLIERRLGSPGGIAAGLGLGGAALALADRRPQTRAMQDARTRDYAWLGVAQAAALIPGISRNGATLTAARWRGFTRPAAARLSWQVALPVLAGAGALKTLRLLGSRDGAGACAPALVAGGAAAAFSTLGGWRIGLGRAVERPLLPIALYRCLVAAFTAGRLRALQSPGPRAPRRPDAA